MTHPGKEELQITDDERARLAMYDFEPVTSGPTPTPSSNVSGRAEALEEAAVLVEAQWNHCWPSDIAAAIRALKDSPLSSSGGRRYAPITDEQINDIVNCGDLSTARIKITRLIHNESGEPERFRRMVERRDEFIIANGLWDAFNEASRED